jgi:hypothetical protein
MPKKYKSRSSSIKPASSVHPSLAVQSDSSAPQAPQGVNELLAQLRIAQTSSSRRVLPTPAVPLEAFDPRLYGVPQPAPSRRQMFIERRRHPPEGPPPPSWLQRQADANARQLPGIKPEYSFKTSRDVGWFPDHSLVKKGSLLDLTFKSMASNWDFCRVYDQHYIPQLSDRLKKLLLHYIAISVPQQHVDYSDLIMIFGVNGYSNTQTSDVSCLDLTGQMGYKLCLAEFGTFLSIRSSKETPEKYVQESWEDAPIPPLITSRLPFLTHLSLANPSSDIKWSQLIKISGQLSTITHLSLARWPTPENGPLRETYEHKKFYDVKINTTEDHELYLRDPAQQIRALSKALICLQYIDLTDCHPWLLALEYEGDNPRNMVDWNGGWQNVHTVILRQSSRPILSSVGKSWLTINSMSAQQGSSPAWRSFPENWTLFYETRPPSSKVVELTERIANLDLWTQLKDLEQRASAVISRARTRFGKNKPPKFVLSNVEDDAAY